MLLKIQGTVAFDPANKEHRLAVKAFMKRQAWADSPFRFSYDPAYGSVAHQVQAKLLDWYIEQEEIDESTMPISKELAFDILGIPAEM